MAAVTKEFIINSLIQYPKSDYEVGFNSSLIMILKKLVEGIETQETKVPVTDIMQFRSAIGTVSNAYALPTDAKIIEAITAIKNGAKLLAVKITKEMLAVDLRSAKDVVDEFVRLTAPI